MFYACPATMDIEGPSARYDFHVLFETPCEAHSQCCSEENILHSGRRCSHSSSRQARLTSNIDNRGRGVGGYMSAGLWLLLFLLSSTIVSFID